jgi:glycolate oxidase FAD binding subunit
LTSSLTETLTGLLGNDGLLPPELLAEYAVDGLKPQAVVQPKSRQAIAEVLRWAASEKLAIVPRGGGTHLSLGNLPSRLDLVLDLSQCNRVLDFEPADLTATVEAGITLEALQRELAQGGKLAPLEAPLAHKATIGGILATNSSGPLRYTYSLPRDWLIGTSVVGPYGVETRAGGKVVKNVTGYDLNKLYTGSLGTLGVIVETTFKLAPVHTDSGALVAVFPSMQKAIDQGQELLKQVYAPQGIHAVNSVVLEKLGVPLASSDEQFVLLTFFTGRSRAVQRRLEESTRLLRDNGASHLERLESQQASTLMRQLTDLGWSPDTAPQLGLKVNLPPSTISEVSTWAQSEQLHRPDGIIADLGFGQAHFFWWRQPGTQEVPDSDAVTATGELRKLVSTLGGSVVVEHCSPSVKQKIDVWGDRPELVELITRIKHSFDPSGILNPGRFMGRL